MTEVADVPEENLPLVSVVIPVLNCAGDVAECVKALRGQVYPSDRLEIIIVDNGSSDGTPELVESLGVTCLHRPERGRSRALNKGLEHARGEIICTTDISCRPEPHWIMEVVRSFRNPEVGCVAGDIRLLKTHDNIAIGYQERRNYMSPMSAQFRTRPPYLPYADGANASFRRAVFEAIGPFEESFIKAADVEICYRMFFLSDYKLAFNSRAVVWEPGEEDLFTLLKQRYRIGIGNVLLHTRFPALFVGESKGSTREIYWRTRSSIRNLIKTLGLAIRGVIDKEARNSLSDRMVSTLMSIAQVLGKRRGVRDLTVTSSSPKPIDSDVIDAYVAGSWSARSRIFYS